MFCPKCGQPQVSDEVRFCVRCGMQLDGVRSIVTNEMHFAQSQIYNQPVSTWQKPGVKTSAKILFLSIFLAPIFLGMSIEADSPGPLIVPFTIFILGILWMTYSLVFGESPIQSRKKKAAAAINAGNAPVYLPPQNETARTLPPQSINTAEMITPSSVTESTTKLLEQK